MPKDDIQFNFNQALEVLKSGKPIRGKDGLLTPLIKQLPETSLQGEQEQHLAKDPCVFAPIVNTYWRAS